MDENILYKMQVISESKWFQINIILYFYLIKIFLLYKSLLFYEMEIYLFNETLEIYRTENIPTYKT